MPRCKYCNQLNKPADCFQDPEFPSNQYCSEDHWKSYNKAKEQKQKVDTSKHKQVSSKPKPPPKFKPKAEPKPKSDRVKLTDYIQEIWPVEPNWEWVGKQIEALCKETGLTYDDMRVVLRYCIEFEGLQVDEAYGLGQFIPRYVQDAFNFREDIKKIKDNLLSIDFEDEFQSVPIGKVKSCRVLKEDVGF